MHSDRQRLYGSTVLGENPAVNIKNQIVLEPEGVDAREIYVNGLSMSLPEAVQGEVVRSLPGWD